jgi:hypothetical protein
MSDAVLSCARLWEVAAQLKRTTFHFHFYYNASKSTPFPTYDETIGILVADALARFVRELISQQPNNQHDPETSSARMQAASIVVEVYPRSVFWPSSTGLTVLIWLGTTGYLVCKKKTSRTVDDDEEDALLIWSRPPTLEIVLRNRDQRLHSPTLLRKRL